MLVYYYQGVLPAKGLFCDSLPDRFDVIFIDIDISHFDDFILEIGEVILYCVFLLRVFDRESLSTHLRQSIPQGAEISVLFLICIYR